MKNLAPRATPAPQKLRFGIFCNGLTLSAWEAQSIQEILRLPEQPELSLVVIDDSTGDPVDYASRTFLQKVRSVGLPNVLYYLYNKGRKPPPSGSSVDISETVKGAEILHCRTVRKGKWSQYFNETDIETIRSHNLDFILRFAFGIVRGEILNAARFGIWSFHHDDPEVYRGGPPCFWEIVNGNPWTGAMLQRITERLDDGMPLRKGYFSTIKTNYQQNIDRVYFQSATWPAQVCKDIVRGNHAYLSNVEKLPSQVPIVRGPNNFQMLRFFIRTLISRAANRLESWGWKDTWALGVVDAPIERFLDPDFQPSVRYIEHPARGKYYADPFGLLKAKGEISILCEDYDHRTELGSLSEVTLFPSGKTSAKAISVGVKTHLSYPFLFQHEGDTYCIPESWKSGEVTLFKAISYPNVWEKKATLIPNFRGVDPTILFDGSRWWLFITNEDNEPNANLYLFYSEKIEGPWYPHPQNPVKSDVRSSRPAGTPFRHAGEWFRPAQNCAKTYGHSVVINKIVALTPDEFKEVTVRTIPPLATGKYRKGLHTLSSVGSKTLIDVKRTGFVLSAFLRRLG